ncbi:MAG TPA: bifunctional folylpolyglutamate synthase/dihydrofolate synthase [Patescibacteria group bacterium]|nr:bifunctional folylpolyglutamate synthase/dihydrofolate synthase [Patescibacteria group bacterium]
MIAPATYADAVAALQARGRFGIRLGLGRTRALLRELGSPELGIRGALVGGTNGKGSVVALVSSCLAATGHRAGAAPKPHLVTYRERLRVGGRLIAAASFADLVGELLPVAERVARRHGPPTEFELMTALVFTWFAREAVDLAVVEVGLGGRLDATHAWDGGVAAVTNVDLDHTEWLGTTVVAIAREEAAIIVRGDRAVTGASGEALPIVRRRARRVGATLVEAAPAPVRAMDLDGLVVDLPGLAATRVGLLGRHQAANVAVADAVLDALGAAGIAVVSPAARRAGYAAARWPGRLELVALPGAGPGGSDAEILLDGAHNPAGAAALAAALDELRPLLRGGGGPRPAPATLILGIMADKDVEGVLGPLAAAPSLAGVRVVATQVQGPRALPALDLAARWARIAGARSGPVTVVAEPAAAVAEAAVRAEGPVVVAGSLYLVGAVRALVVDDPDLRDPA